MTTEGTVTTDSLTTTSESTSHSTDDTSPSHPGKGDTNLHHTGDTSS